MVNMTIKDYCTSLLRLHPADKDIKVEYDFKTNIANVYLTDDTQYAQNIELEADSMGCKNIRGFDIELIDLYNARLCIHWECDGAKISIRRHVINTGERLKQLRIMRGYTQEYVADVTGINLRMLQAYEQGTKDINNASVTTVVKLLKALDYSVDKFFSNTIPDLDVLYGWQEDAVKVIKEYLGSDTAHSFFIRGYTATGKSTLVRSIMLNYMEKPILNGTLCYDASKTTTGVRPYIISVLLAIKDDGLRYIKRIDLISFTDTQQILYEYIG